MDFGGELQRIEMSPFSLRSGVDLGTNGIALRTNKLASGVRELDDHTHSIDV
ncbi:MAG: hypothetical protein AAF745_01000 [Planctomycetota bacterium]